MNVSFYGLYRNEISWLVAIGTYARIANKWMVFLPYVSTYEPSNDAIVWNSIRSEATNTCAASRLCDAFDGLSLLVDTMTCIHLSLNYNLLLFRNKTQILSLKWFKYFKRNKKLIEKTQNLFKTNKKFSNY